MLKKKLSNEKKNYLEEKSRELKRECLSMVMRAKCGHLAPALSCADIITALFFEVMNIDCNNPKDEPIESPSADLWAVITI